MIFFDIDETLLDHGYAQEMAAKSFLKEQKDILPYQEDEFVKLWKELAHYYFDLYVMKRLTYPEQRRIRMKRVFQTAGVNLSDKQLDDKFEVFLQFYEMHWRPFDDVLPCLNELQKYQLGIISNGNYERQVKKLERIGVLSYFSTIITSSLVGVAKPDPSIFREACRKFNKLPNKCFYIGDQYETDAMASTQAGMKGIWLNRKKSEGMSIPIPMVHSLHYLPKLLSMERNW